MMNRQMLRAKQALSEAECREVMERNTAGVLSLVGDEGYPYGVPLSYVYENGKIYFHSAKRGYKVECIERNPKVSFTVIDTDDIVAEEYTTYFRSVIAVGTVRLTEGEERFKGFMALTNKYSGIMPEEDKLKTVEGCKGAHLYVVDVQFLTGKQAIELVKQK